MKKFISGFIIGAIIFSSITVIANPDLVINPNTFPIFVDNTKTDVEAYNIDGYTFVKLADVSKALGGKVEVLFNQSENIIEINSINLQESLQTDLDETNNEELQTYIKDGFTIFFYNDVEYISIEEFNKKHDGEVIRYGISSGTLKYSNKNIEKKTNLLENIPIKLISKKLCLEYDYYLKHIIPLLN